ncbi:MAG: DUF2922 domain-containing protein [Defluviitaleaceae bacterium]|nr:DUF2922 domain-containing protein [Defluviitaleaceae bacterium]
MTPPVTTHSCVLTFNTSLDGTRLVRIPDPRANLTASCVVSGASGFLAVNPFDETVGTLTSLRSADLVTETRFVLI